MSEPYEMQLFLQAIELAGQQRQELLDKIDDETLRGRVTALLRADEELGDSDPFTPILAQHAEKVLSPLIGGILDGYRIEREIGRGGMGVVFEAQQQHPERRVAIKTLPFSAASDEDGRQRLAREADALARLSHPGIAQVYRFGHAAAFDGVPYLAMEFVDGEPIDAYCAAHQLDVLARLKLLVSLCEAVAHAHTQRVLHRDLKPQNVLVDNDGRVKVLDFGIARVLDDANPSLQTRSGQVLGTLTYMAPEQLAAVSGRGKPPSAQIDVYALGVMAYELLVGRPPIDIPTGSLATIIRHLADAEPAQLGRHCPELRSTDIEKVIGKALARDPAHRYADAGALQRDIERVLDNEPVVARPPSTVYQLRKFVRRHRVACAVAVAVLATLTAGLVWALHERGIASEARGTAEQALVRERDRGRALESSVGIMRDLILQTVPHVNDGEPPNMEQIVAQFSDQADELYADQPFVLGRIHLLLFGAKRLRDDPQAATHHLARARACLEQSELVGPTTEVHLKLAEADHLLDKGQTDSAIAALEQLLLECKHLENRNLERNVARRLAGTLASLLRELPRAEQLIRQQLRTVPHESLQWRDLHTTLSTVLGAAGQTEEAIESWRTDIELARKYQPGSLRLATMAQNLGHYLTQHGRDVEGFPLVREALDIRRSILRERPHRELAIALDNFAMNLRGRGEYADALEFGEEAFAMFTKLYAEPHPDTAVCLTEIGITLKHMGRLRQAEAKLRAALDVFEALAETPSPQHAAALENFVMLDGSPEQQKQCVALAKRAVAIREQVHGPGHVLVARALEALARAHYVHKDWQRAASAGQRAIDLRIKAYSEDDARTWLSVIPVYLGMARRGNRAEAANLIDRAIAGCDRSATPLSKSLMITFHRHLLQLRTGLGHTDAANKVRERLVQLTQ